MESARPVTHEYRTELDRYRRFHTSQLEIRSTPLPSQVFYLLRGTYVLSGF